jgi:uncharacterized protein (DUF1697 family)
MAVHIVLLRAVNVGGTGKLPMAELRAMCADAGFGNAETYIASGNVVLESALPPDAVKAALEKRLEAYAGKPVGMIVLSPAEIEAVEAANPFPDAPGNRVIVTFLGDEVPEDALTTIRHQAGEIVETGKRAIYVRYPDGPSKLVIPAARNGTGRNLNTVRKLIDMARARA